VSRAQVDNPDKGCSARSAERAKAKSCVTTIRP
jgi:hypothetical protein